MNIITEKDLNDEINILKNDTKKTISHLKSLHRREKNIKCQKLIRDWSECYLDLYQIRNGKIDFNSDPDFLLLQEIRDNFYKLMM